MTVHTGPNASTACIALARRGVAAQRAASAEERALARDRRPSSSRRSPRSPADEFRFASQLVRPAEHLAALRERSRAAPCARPRAAGRRPTTLASAAWSAATTSSSCARRHDAPCESPCTSGPPSPSSRARLRSRTGRTPGCPGAASGPSIEELSESVSADEAHRVATIDAGAVRSFCAVLAEPVNATASWQSR